MAFNKYITKASDLVTSHEQTRAGFLSIALEKNRLGDPYVNRALVFKSMVSETTGPRDFLAMPQVRPFLLTASGLSDKSMNYLTETDQTGAIEELIKNFLEPAGENYIDEAIYRYLLIKGDAVGGSMRNRIGALGEEKLIRCILSCMSVQGIDYKWAENITNKFPWHDKSADDTGIEQRMKALHWKNKNGDNRLLAFNMNISTVKKNVDICLFSSDYTGFNKGKIASEPDKAIMMGELKGGIDPAGADEHWKTANTALERIRTKFSEAGYSVFADPHFEYDNGNLYNSLRNDNKKAYIVAEGEKVNGLFVWLILPNEKYIEMLIGLSKEESSIREMLAFIENEYKDYQLDFVINPRHNLFCNLLQSKNAKFEEEQQWMAWEKEIDNQYQHEIVLLTQEYEAQYIDKHNKDTYWTAEKVIEAKDRFRVFLAIHEEKVVGYIDVTYCYEKNEPYAIWVDNEFQNKGYEQALLQAAIKMNKPNKMMVLVDINNFDEIEMFKSIGFVPVIGTNSVYATYKS